MNQKTLKRLTLFVPKVLLFLIYSPTFPSWSLQLLRYFGCLVCTACLRLTQMFSDVKVRRLRRCNSRTIYHHSVSAKPSWRYFAVICGFCYWQTCSFHESFFCLLYLTTGTTGHFNILNNSLALIHCRKTILFSPGWGELRPQVKE